jgi:hypothetical protein
MAEVALQTLHVVAKELGLTLGEARESLEVAYVERYRELVEANQRLKTNDLRRSELMAVKPTHNSV